MDLLTLPLGWHPVDDVVMGGVSRSAVLPLPGGGLRFRGEVSLEQGGGFASIRTAPAALGLSGITGFRLDLCGDGKTYDLRVYRRDVRIPAGSYRAPLPTSGVREVVELPLTGFVAVTRGRPVPGAPALEGAGAAIEALGFLISGRQAGPFQLDVFALIAV